MPCIFRKIKLGFIVPMDRIVGTGLLDGPSGILGFDAPKFQPFPVILRQNLPIVVKFCRWTVEDAGPYSENLLYDKLDFETKSSSFIEELLS